MYQQANVLRAVPPRNSTTFDERRRHVRHKLSSIIYVGLGPNNGGILINLGEGGLSLQAVAELDPETELTLHFQLQSTEQAIETAGRVTWLGPTQKEAGICFENLPGNAEQQITEWIARLEQPTQSPEAKTELHPKFPPTSGEAPVRPVQTSIQTVLHRNEPENAPPSPAPGIPSESLSESSRSDDPSIAAEAICLPALPFLTPRFRVRPEERFGSQLGKSVESAAEHSEPPLDPARPSMEAAEILPRDVLLPSWTSPSDFIISTNDRVPAVRESSTSESRWRHRKVAIAVVAGVIGILGLIVVVSTLSELLGAGGSGGQPVEPISPAAIAPSSAPPTGPAVGTGHGAKTLPSPGAPTGANSAPPIPATHKAVAMPRDDGWIARLRALLGMDVDTKIDPAIFNVPVWTIQRSGFYYCADSPDFEKLRQSTVMMTQGEALQSGYQPKLGSYCQ
jgi:hypothetical protein